MFRLFGAKKKEEAPPPPPAPPKEEDKKELPPIPSLSEQQKRVDRYRKHRSKAR